MIKNVTLLLCPKSSPPIEKSSKQKQLRCKGTHFSLNNQNKRLLTYITPSKMYFTPTFLNQDRCDGSLKEIARSETEREQIPSCYISLPQTVLAFERVHQMSMTEGNTTLHTVIYAVAKFDRTFP